MTALLRKDKKGISIMVGYVLLVVISVGIAGIVWGFLNFYLPGERPECPNDVNLVVSEVSCSNSTISLVLENKGLFSIDGAFVKIGESDRVAKETLCFNSQVVGDCSNFFVYETTTEGRAILQEGLRPGEKIQKSFNLTEQGSPGEKELELEPVVFVSDSESAICTKALVSRTVECI